jgi:hypothetical protein
MSLDGRPYYRELYRCRPNAIDSYDDAMTAVAEALDNLEGAVVFTSSETDRLREAGVDLVEEQYRRRLALVLAYCRQAGVEFAELQTYWANHPWGQGARWTRW